MSAAGVMMVRTMSFDPPDFSSNGSRGCSVAGCDRTAVVAADVCRVHLVDVLRAEGRTIVFDQPDFAALERRLQGLNRPPAASRHELVTRPDVLALYQEIVDALNLELSQFERIKRIALLESEFTADSGELTPTMKVKRNVVNEKYAERFDALYGGGTG